MNYTRRTALATIASIAAVPLIGQAAPPTEAIRVTVPLDHVTVQTDGSYTLTLKGHTTAALRFGCSAETVRAALQAATGLEFAVTGDDVGLVRPDDLAGLIDGQQRGRIRIDSIESGEPSRITVTAAKLLTVDR